jgi:large subunit ribosomal protein L9
MKVVLFKSLNRLGNRGQIVDVAPGYFRNYLAPRGIAAEATSANLKRLEQQKKQAEKIALRDLADAKSLTERLEAVQLKVSLKAGESDRLFGSVTAADIAEQLKAAGYDIDKKRISLSESIKKLGMYTIHVKLHPEVTAKVKLLVDKE